MLESTDLFQPDIVRSPLPFRERATLPPGCLAFGPDDDGFGVFVTPTALAALQAGTQAAAPKESIGLVVGRTFRDAAGSYTLVVGAVYPSPGSYEASAGHVRLRPAQMAALQQQALRAYPGVDIVGWTHAHERPSGYSQTDRIEQQTWTDDAHLGVLSFMRAPDALAVYRGPDARLLPGAPEPVVQPERDWFTPIALPAAGPSRTPTASNSPAVARVHPIRRQPFPLGNAAIVVLAVVLVLILGLGALRVTDQLAQLNRRLATLTAAAIPTIPAALRWHCTLPSDRASLAVTCHGPVGQGIIGWAWSFGDGTSATGPAVVHRYAQPGTYTISLTVLTPTGSRTASTQTIAVARPAPLLR